MAKKAISRSQSVRKSPSTAARATKRESGDGHDKKAARPAAGPRSAGPAARSAVSEEQLLTRAEADIAVAIDGLNRQMNSALATLTELASAHNERGKAVVRTAPLDRATATFQRLVAEVVDEQLSEMLPPLVALRTELGRRVQDDAGDEFAQRAVQTLDHVFSLVGVQSYTPHAADPFDPLIHMAVGETRRGDLADGVVSDVLAPGFRSGRGKVLAAAKVRVNRR